MGLESSFDLFHVNKISLLKQFLALSDCEFVEPALINCKIEVIFRALHQLFAIDVTRFPEIFGMPIGVFIFDHVELSEFQKLSVAADFKHLDLNWVQ